MMNRTSEAPRAVAIVLVTIAVAACSPKSGGNEARGPGLKEASLGADAQVAVYAAAAGAAFDVGPGLSLLADPQYLPRTTGYDGGDAVPTRVLGAMRDRGLTRGTCEPARDAKAVPVCKAQLPGYVVRYSPVLKRGGDTVEVYVQATQYRTAPNQPATALRFERAYQVVGSGSRWRVVSEGRVPTK